MTIKTLTWEEAVAFAKMLDQAVTVTEWSDGEGDDSPALLGRHHVLWHGSAGWPAQPAWHVQAYTTFDDHSVGIVGQLEPGAIVGSHDDPLAALRDFFKRHFAATLDDALSDFADALSEP